MNRFFTAYLLSQAWNNIRQSPNFIAAVIISLGLTMGALLSIMTLAYNVFFKPLPYPEQQDQSGCLFQQMRQKFGLYARGSFSH